MISLGAHISDLKLQPINVIKNGFIKIVIKIAETTVVKMVVIDLLSFSKP